MVIILLFKLVALLSNVVTIYAAGNCGDLKGALVDLTEENAYLRKCTRNPFTYKVTPTVMTWQGAQAYCVKQGGSLAVHGMRGLLLGKRAEIFSNYTAKNLWIGANDLDTEGVWTWLDGEKVADNDMHWMPGEPNDYREKHAGGEDCAAMAPGWGYKSNDLPCTKNKDVYGLCEISNCLYSTLKKSGGDHTMLIDTDGKHSAAEVTTASVADAGNAASDSKYSVNLHILLSILFYSLLSSVCVES